MTPPAQEVAVHVPISSHPSILRVIPWHDPIVDSHGHNVNDPYIEMFWLPILGPTATWLYRRLVTGLDESADDSFDINMADLARSIGVSHTEGKHNPFARALQRCIMFGAVQHIAIEPLHTVAVRRLLPTLPHRHVQRLPRQLQIAHHDWTHVPTASGLPRSTGHTQ